MVLKKSGVFIVDMRSKPSANAVLLGTILVVLLPAGLARATVSDLGSLASSHASIQYRWTFDTGAEGGFRDALTGGVDLENARSNPTYQASQVAGFDASTQAMQTYRYDTNRDNGAALRTAADISLPSSGTVEYIFKADATLGGGYITSGVPSNGNRHYFGYDQAGVGPRLGFGDPGQYRQLLGGSTGVSYTAGKWYYVAISYEPEDASHTRFNAYVANLTDGTAGDNTTRTISDVVLNDTAGGSMRFGIGCYGKDGNHYLDGSLDQVSVYGAALSQTELDSHLDAIHSTPDLRCDLSYLNYRNPAIDKQWMPDASSWNNDAVLGTSSGNTTWDPSPVMYGFDFDPADGGDELTLARNKSLQVADIGGDSDMSIEMWLRPDQITQGLTLVDGRSPTTSTGWVAWLNGDGSLTLKFYQNGPAWDMTSNSGLLAAGDEQQHVVISLDADSSGGGSVDFYVDGEAWGTDTYSGASSYVDPSDPYRIGHQRHGATSLTPFDGEIGAFRLYSSALDAAEVRANYIGQAHLFRVPEPSGFLLVLLAGASLLAGRKRRKK